MNKSKKESEVFSELEKLCTSKGYIHIISFFCFQNNISMYGDELTVDDIQKFYSEERLIANEISTLIGLMSKKPINFDIPKPDILQKYIVKTEKLLQELHHAMTPPIEKIFNKKEKNPFMSGEMLREAIFYGGESAYDFQYLDLINEKYKKDYDWIYNNKGFKLEEIKIVIQSIITIQTNKINNFKDILIGTHPKDWTTLSIFSFSIDELIKSTSMEKDIIINILNCFSFSIENDTNKEFKGASDLNFSNILPILKFDNNYILFQHYRLLEALYENPFFWFLDDKKYKNIGMKNRGDFTEEISVKYLKRVFGEKNVLPNIDIYEKKNKVGEIDVLVIYADRAIVLQAKSKKLTLESRKGNDKQISDDFKKAIQDSYDQGFDCSKYLLDQNSTLMDTNSNEISINRKLKEVYIFCIVSDHYPALAFQTDQFLTTKEFSVIKNPFVMDIFLLDVMTEMLESPLYFLSYINRRITYFKKVSASQELIILSYHLKSNLFLSDEFTHMMLAEDIASYLDQAMLVRRKGYPGKRTPDGILTKFENTMIGNWLKDLSYSEDYFAIELGIFLLQLSEEAINQINDQSKAAIVLFEKDKKNHDITIGFDESSTGLSIHFNMNSNDESKNLLFEHCRLRKYKQKAKNWFGLCIDPINKKIRFGLMSNKDYNFSEELDNKIKNFEKKIVNSDKKIGRNMPCPCGSGKKYKKCCLWMIQAIS